MGVYTTMSCESACALAFLGGTTRILAPGARLGFHGAMFTEGASDRASRTNRKLATALLGYGIPRDFVEKVSTIRVGSAWYPSRPELHASGIITSVEP
jgi:hypothetical protein